MATIGVLIDDKDALVVPMSVAEHLARLGITHLTVLSGDGSTLVVLEGWAFDPASGQDAVGLLLAGPGEHARVLHTTMQLSLSPPSATRSVARGIPCTPMSGGQGRVVLQHPAPQWARGESGERQGPRPRAVAQRG